jgi:hypothetical protein
MTAASEHVRGEELTTPAPDWIQLAPDRGGSFLAFEPATGPTAPGMPPGFRTRIDIEVDDMDVAKARIEELGGRLVQVIHARPGESHYPMADPEGNEFTVVLPLPPEEAQLAYGERGAPG